MTLRLGSFNVLKLSMKTDKERDDSKAAKHIAAIAKKQEFEILALQEVLTQDAVDEIVKHLGKASWAGVHSGDTTKDYGFIWNTKRVALVQDPEVYSQIKMRVGYIWQNHINAMIGQIRTKSDADSEGTEDGDVPSGSPMLVAIPEIRLRLIEAYKANLLRPPFVGCFRSSGWWGKLRWELRVINTHIRFLGTTLTAKLTEQERLAEYTQIAGRMHTALNTLRFGDFRTVYTVIAGDYNFSLGNWQRPLVEYYFDLPTEQLSIIPVCVTEV